MTSTDPHDPLGGLPGYSLRRAANAMTAELSARLKPLDLRVSDVSLMMVIADRRDLTSSDVGRILDIQRANMVPLLHRLESEGLVTRAPMDRKSMAIVLTEAGRERLARANAVTRQFDQDLMAKLPEAAQPHFLPALDSLWR